MSTDTRCELQGGRRQQGAGTATACPARGAWKDFMEEGTVLGGRAVKKRKKRLSSEKEAEVPGRGQGGDCLPGHACPSWDTERRLGPQQPPWEGRDSPVGQALPFTP